MKKNVMLKDKNEKFSIWVFTRVVKFEAIKNNFQEIYPNKFKKKIICKNQTIGTIEAMGECPQILV